MMSERSLIAFFRNNDREYEALTSFFQDYESEMNELINNFKKKIRRLEATNHSPEIARELASRKNSLNNFLVYVDNVREILAIIKYMKDPYYTAEHEVESDYLVRLSYFVESEIYYFRNGKRKPNYRGLVKLTLKVENLTKQYTNLVPPRTASDYNDKRNAILRAYKSAILAIYSPKDELLSQEDDFADPDSIMFLESEDYEALLKPDSTEEEIVSVSSDIEALKSRQGKYGKL